MLGFYSKVSAHLINSTPKPKRFREKISLIMNDTMTNTFTLSYNTRALCHSFNEEKSNTQLKALKLGENPRL